MKKTITLTSEYGEETATLIFEVPNINPLTNGHGTFNARFESKKSGQSDFKTFDNTQEGYIKLITWMTKIVTDQQQKLDKVNVNTVTLKTVLSEMGFKDTDQ